MYVRECFQKVKKKSKRFELHESVALLRHCKYNHMQNTQTHVSTDLRVELTALSPIDTHQSSPFTATQCCPDYDLSQGLRNVINNGSGINWWNVDAHRVSHMFNDKVFKFQALKVKVRTKHCGSRNEAKLTAHALNQSWVSLNCRSWRFTTFL